VTDGWTAEEMCLNFWRQQKNSIVQSSQNGTVFHQACYFNLYTDSKRTESEPDNTCSCSTEANNNLTYGSNPTLSSMAYTNTSSHNNF